MKITKEQLRRIIREEKAKLLRESVADMMEIEAVVRRSGSDISTLFENSMAELFAEDPEMFQGRSTEEEWMSQVDRAAGDLEDRIIEAINREIGRVETELHDGQFLY